MCANKTATSYYLNQWLSSLQTHICTICPQWFKGILADHEDVIQWKHFPRHWPLWGEFTGNRWIPRTKGQWRGTLMLFYLRQNKRLSKQSWGWWFEKLSRPLWRHCNDHRYVIGAWTGSSLVQAIACRNYPWWRHPIETFSVSLAFVRGIHL